MGLGGLSHTLKKHAAASTINADIAIKKPPERAVFYASNQTVYSSIYSLI